MYEQFYGLRESAFGATPNRHFLFMTPQHRQALDCLQFGVQARKGLTLLIGEAGTGKTTLVRALLAGIESSGGAYAYVNNPRLTRGEFVEAVARGFRLSEAASVSKTTLLLEMEQALVAAAHAGKLAALVVDEAQSLSDEMLEEVRLLANIETDSMKLLPVVLAGQPELSGRLAQHTFRQLRQRVSLHCKLGPLSLRETASYIVKRVAIAGGDGAGVFTRDAVELIHDRSGGIPRLVNTICDNALIAGFAMGVRPVTRRILLEVCSDRWLHDEVAAVDGSGAPGSGSGSTERPFATERGAAAMGHADASGLVRTLTRKFGLSARTPDRA